MFLRAALATRVIVECTLNDSGKVKIQNGAFAAKMEHTNLFGIQNFAMRASFMDLSTKPLNANPT